MKTVNIHEAKTHFSKLIAEVGAGEEFVIAKAGKPVAKLVSISKGQRQLGLLDGKAKIPDDFDAPLPDEILALFYGEEEKSA